MGPPGGPPQAELHLAGPGGGAVSGEGAAAQCSSSEAVVWAGRAAVSLSDTWLYKLPPFLTKKEKHPFPHPS